MMMMKRRIDDDISVNYVTIMVPFWYRPLWYRSIGHLGHFDV
jgi:hypothetical protein